MDAKKDRYKRSMGALAVVRKNFMVLLREQMKKTTKRNQRKSDTKTAIVKAMAAQERWWSSCPCYIKKDSE